MHLANQVWHLLIAQEPYSPPEIALKDFQELAYASEYEPLQELAIQKALAAVLVDNVDQMMEDFPKTMLAGFMKGLVQDRQAVKDELSGMQWAAASGNGRHYNQYPASFQTWS